MTRAPLRESPRPRASNGAHGNTGRPVARAALARGLGFFGFWLLLVGPGSLDGSSIGLSAGLAHLAGDLVLGLAASLVATRVSLRLLPPSPVAIHCAALAKLAARFLAQSILAGLDVARRAFDPRLPLNPGYLAYPLRIPQGRGRAVFGAYTSLMPGTLPVGTDETGALVYHCLDQGQPIASGLARDEALLRQVGIQRGADV